MRSVLTLFCLLCSGFAFATPVVHHFASSLAEVEYNAETKRLEVALSMAPADLEWVLSRRAEKRVSLEHTDGVDTLVEDYLEEVFRATHPKHGKAPLTWIGKEFEGQLIWLFFELELPHGPKGVELSNRVLLRWERDQVNTVNLRLSGRNRTLTFDRRHTSLPIIPDEIEQETTGDTAYEVLAS